MTPLPHDAAKRIKDAAQSAGAVVCGVADAAAFEPHAPAGHRPANPSRRD